MSSYNGRTMKKVFIALAVVVLAAVGFWGYNKSKLDAARAITTYDACVEAGFTVVKGTPDRCLTPDGRTLEAAVVNLPTTLLDGTYAVNVDKTKVYWEGRKKFVDNYVDRGTIMPATSSVITVGGGVPTTTSVVTFDMNSIATESTGKGSGQDGLTNHLKSDDFFNVAKFPTAKFVLARVETSTSTPGDYVLVGSLTVRDVTKEIRIPARITMTDGALSITGEAIINRADFNVKFGSTSFFKELVGDRVIEDQFKLVFTIIADKK